MLKKLDARMPKWLKRGTGHDGVDDENDHDEGHEEGAARGDVVTNAAEAANERNDAGRHNEETDGGTEKEKATSRRQTRKRKRTAVDEAEDEYKPKKAES